MPRHPGLQHHQRMREIGDRVTNMHLLMLTYSQEAAALQEKIETLNKKKRSLAAEMIPVLIFQEEMLGLEALNSWGLPVRMTPEEYETLTGAQVRDR